MTILLILIFFLNLLIFFKLKNISNFINIFDYPDNILKKHHYKVPSLGGLILLTNLIVIFVYNFFFSRLIIFDFTNIEYLSMFFLITVFFSLGLIDDKYKISPEKRLITSIIFVYAALSLNSDLIITQLNFSFYKNTIYLNNFSFFFTVFSILVLVNSLNFYDGINCQSIIFLIVGFLYLSINSNYSAFYYLLVMVLFFLLYLNYRNKIFLGDSGIYLSAILLSICLIYEYNIFESILYADHIFIVLLLPGIDLLRLFFTRIIRGKNPFHGDRLHVQHLLINNLSILKSNLVLLILILIPIFLTILEINFFLIFSYFVITYLLTIYKFQKYD